MEEVTFQLRPKVKKKLSMLPGTTDLSASARSRVAEVGINVAHRGGNSPKATVAGVWWARGREERDAEGKEGRPRQ